MNALINCSKYVPKTIFNLAKNDISLPRKAAFSKLIDYKIKWVRPEKISVIDPRKSGDLELKVDVKGTDIGKSYELSSELKDCDENVKKMFQLDFLPQKETSYTIQEKLLDSVKRHELDRSSIEARITIMTTTIRRLQQHMKENPRNTRVKVFLKELIEKRQKYLKGLREKDYKCFEWLIEKLNIVYRPAPEVAGGPYRKDSIRKLTKRRCDEIVWQKLEAYKVQLKKEQVQFFKEKAEKLAFIRQEEIACGVDQTVTEEDIENARKKYEELISTG